jgi:hypothetical protein
MKNRVETMVRTTTLAEKIGSVAPAGQGSRPCTPGTRRTRIRGVDEGANVQVSMLPSVCGR